MHKAGIKVTCSCCDIAENVSFSVNNNHSLKIRSNFIPAGEHRLGSSPKIETTAAINWQDSSDNLTSLVGTWKPVLGAEGFNTGICLVITHIQASKAAKTRDFPGSMSPDSPPSPITTVLSVVSMESVLLSVLTGESFSEITKLKKKVLSTETKFLYQHFNTSPYKTTEFS